MGETPQYSIMTLGDAVRSERQKKKWTLKQLADRCTNISVSYLSEIERGKKKNPSAKVLSNIATAFKLNVDYFCKYM